MTGLIALAGSGEYLDVMNEVDRRLLAARSPGAAGPPRVVCLPTAAAPEGPETVERWARLGREHFTRLGAQVESAYLLDRASAADPRWVSLIEAADLIYFSGGDPLYLLHTLQDTPAWAAVQAARARGAVYAGCSAGAMIAGAFVPNVRSLDFEVHPAFGLVPGFILPHFDRMESFRPGATAFARSRLADGQYLLGIDENTALVGTPDEEWEVLGAGSVSVLGRVEGAVYPAGSRLLLPGAGR